VDEIILTTLLYLIGTSSLAGIFMQANQTVLPVGSFPVPQAYNLIFLTAMLMSILSIVLVGTITRRKAKPKIVIK
jgi:hypothetical protein